MSKLRSLILVAATGLALLLIGLAAGAPLMTP